MLKSNMVKHFCIGLVLSCCLLALFAFNAANAGWPGGIDIPEVKWNPGQDIEDMRKKTEEALRKAEEDTRIATEKAAEDARVAAEKARQDVLDELNRFNNNYKDTVNKARQDVAAELSRIPNNVSDQAREQVEAQISSQLNELREGIAVQQDLIVQQVTTAITNLVPGFAQIRLALIAKNIAQASEKFGLVSSNTNQLMNNINGWPTNNQQLPPSCNGVKTNLKEMFDPFLTGEEAEVMNLKASVRQLSDPLNEAAYKICDVVDQGQQLANEGKELQNTTTDSLKQLIQEDLANRMRNEIQAAIVKATVAAISPF